MRATATRNHKTSPETSGLAAATTTKMRVKSITGRRHSGLSLSLAPIISIILLCQRSLLSSTGGSVGVYGFTTNGDNHRAALSSTSISSRYRFTSPTQKTTTTAMHMVATKSGGRAILTTSQFQNEVLKINSGECDSNDDEEECELEDSGSSEPKLYYDNSNKPTLVLYSAPWCGPCRLSNPVVREIIKEFVPTIDVVEVCTDDLPDIAEGAGVVSIPTIQIYHEGELMDTIVGCVAKNVLASAVNKVLEDVGLLNGTPQSGNDSGSDSISSQDS